MTRIDADVRDGQPQEGDAEVGGGPHRTASAFRRTVRRLMAAAAAVAASALVVGALVEQRSSPWTDAVELVDEVAVTPTDHSALLSNTSPSIVADPAEARFVVMANRIEAPDFGCALQVSGDGGRTWLTANPVTDMPVGADKCYAPEVAFGPDGTLYYLFVGLHGNGNEPMGGFLVTSADHGQTFTAPREVIGPLNFAVRMAIDRSPGSRGRIHLVWIKATSDPPLGGFGPPPNPILAAHSDDGGRTFSEPVQVSDRSRERVVAPALAVGPGGEVHVAYYDLGRDAVDYQGLEGPVWDEAWTIVVSTSFDGGRRFGPGRVVDQEIRPVERVTLIFTMPAPALVAGSHGLLCLAWGDARHGDADVLARCSDDEGDTWRDARRVNDDRMGNGVRQYLPALSLSPQGRLDALFLDRRDDRSNAYNHVYLTYSTNGGRSFAPNHRVSQEPADIRIGAQYANASARGQYEIGSRLGLLSERSRAVAAWPDTRHSLPGTTGHDLFSAAIALPEARRPPLGPRLAAAGLGLAGLVVIASATLRRRRRLPGAGEP